MTRLILYIFCSLISISGFSQVVKLGESFSDVPMVQGKVVFLKEIPAKKGFSTDANYNVLKDWAKNNYGRDPFISSVRYDTRNKEIIAKSRIELLLPANTKGVREKMIMRYRVNTFLFEDKCVLEITDISYMYQNTKGDQTLPKIVRAEDFITDKALDINDILTELRSNTRKSTLFFLNELAKDFEKQFNF